MIGSFMFNFKRILPLFIIIVGVVFISYEKNKNEPVTRKVTFSSDDLAGLYLHKGIDLGKQSFYQEGIDWFKQAIALKPDFAESYLCMGNAYRYLENYDEAIESYKKVIELDPERSAAYFYLGLSYKSIGDSEQLNKQYNKLKSKNEIFALRLHELM